MAKNNVKQLNQDYERLVEVLDATDDALKVKDESGNPYEANLNKIWTTAVDIQTDDSGVETRVSKITPVSFADFTEYQDIKTTTDDLNETINNEATGVLAQLASVNEQLEQISNILGDDFIVFNITPIPSRNYSVVYKNKQDLVIKYKFKSTNSTGSTGPGTVTWKIGTKTVLTETIQQNTTEKDDPAYDSDYNSFDFSEHAHIGKNEIVGIFDNEMGSDPKEIVWTITAVDLSLSIIDFNETQLYDDKIPVKYRVSGLGSDDSALVFFQLDQNTPSAISFSGLDSQKTFTVPKQSHGSHLLSIYAEATINGSKLITNKQLLDLMCIEEGQTLPIIRWPYDESLVLEQYSDYDFNYSVYDPQNTTANIKRYATINYIDNNNQESITEQLSWTNTSDWSLADEKSLIWKFTPEVNIQKGDNSKGTVTLSIECGEGERKVVKTKTFTLIPSKVNINPVTDQLVLDFNPKGRTNQDINYNEFVYENNRHNTIMSVSDNFDWNRGGWQKDEYGQDVFIIKTGCRMTLDYPLFAEKQDAKSEGRHIKITYKATNCASFDATVMSCVEYQGKRHEITPEEFYLNTDGEIESKTNTKRYFIDGYNLNDETDSLIWKDGEIGGELISKDCDTDKREADGTGIIYHIHVSDSYIGLKLNAQEGTLHSSYNDLPLVYCEDEKMSLSVDVEKSGSENDRLNLMTGYVDADPIRVVKYDNSTSFTQKKMQQIEFGSDECDVLLYRFKVFTKHLTSQRTTTTTNEVFDDYIADIANVNERIEAYNKNNFLNPDGTIDIEALQEKCPDLRIILITCPDRFTIDKDDKVKGCTVEHILPSGGPKDHWIAENVQIKGQGTSSNAYGTSARNIDIKLNKNLVKDENGNVVKDDNGNEQELDYALIYWDENGEEQHAKKYSMSGDAIAVNYFNIKVNVASSESANNACLADWFNEFNPYERAVKTNGVRDTMEFHPCVIFIREENVDEWVEFEPEYDENNQLKYHFYACGDFGNSKKNHDVFGMGKQAELDIKNAGDSITIDGVEYPLTTDEEKEAAIHKLQLKECIVEFSNNTHPVCLFEKPDGWDYILPDCFDFNNMQVTQYANFWSGDAIEFRYPEDVVEGSYNKDDEFTEEEIAEARERLAVLQPQVQRLWGWVESTDYRKATNQLLVPSVTLLAPSAIQSERLPKTYDYDTAEYRQAKFLAEYEQYFERQSMLFHYLFTDRYLMIDNRVKNVFLHTTDGLIWDFCFNYDDDTSLGCENSGFLTLDYNLEDCDKINDIDVYNGNSSVLWENVRTILIPELKAMYNNDACKDAWSSNALLGKMTRYQEHKPILLEMMDMYRKYIRPYKTGHGRSNVSESQYLERMNGRKALQRQRFEIYRDIYTGSKYQAASFSSSNNDITFRINKNGGIMEITPYCDMYPAIKWGDAYYTPIKNKRVRRNETCYIDLTPGGINVGDQELHFCGASMLSDLGPLAKFQIKSAGFESGTKLKRILLGDKSGANSSNVAIQSMSLPTTPLLQVVDVSNTRYSNALDFTNQPMIKEVYCKNSDVPAVTFAKNGIVETVDLNALSSLTMIGLTKLKDFQINNDLLSEIHITNTPYLTTGERAISFIKTEIPKKASGRIDGVDVIVSEENINMFDKYIVNNSSSMEFIGKAYFNKFYESMKTKYELIWPQLEITYDSMNFIPQYLIRWQNPDGTLLYEEYIDDGNSVTDPVERGKIDSPTLESTAQYDYIWDTEIKWNNIQGNTILNGIPRKDCVFEAVYISKIRQYNVTWKAANNTTYTHTFNYGQSAAPDMEQLDINSYEQNNRYYVFTGWDKPTGYITNNLVVEALWEVSSLPPTSFPTNQMNMAALYAISRQDQQSIGWKTYFSDNEQIASANGNRIQFRMGHNPDYSKVITTHKIVSTDNVMQINTNNPITPTDDSGNPYTLFDASEKYSKWTLIIEYKPHEDQTEKNVIAACSLNSIGFMIGRQGNSIIQLNGTVGNWTASNEQCNSRIPNARNRIVLQRINNELKVFISNPWEHEPTIITTTLESTTNAPLILGGLRDSYGDLAALGKGWIYECTLWEQPLGDSECEQLVSWTGEQISFDAVAINDETHNGRVTFHSSGVLHFPQSLHFSYKKPTNWFETDSYRWMNNRVYNAMPHGIQQLIGLSTVSATNYATTTITTKTDVKLWLPSINELIGAYHSQINMHAVWPKEGPIVKLYVAPRSTTKWSDAWLPSFNSIDLFDIATYKQIDEPTNPQEGDVWYKGTYKFADYSKATAFTYIYHNKEWIPETGATNHYAGDRQPRGRDFWTRSVDYGVHPNSEYVHFITSYTGFGNTSIYSIKSNVIVCMVVK